jgi:hypothetical protein
MKTVYYIVAPSCSGKSTAATKLSEQMGIPRFHADSVYIWLFDTFKPKVAAPEKLIVPEAWDSPANFGLESWGDYPNIREAKAFAFKRMIGPRETDFIIEGFTLSLPEERELVRRAVGPHRSVILRIDLPFEQWVKFRDRRWGAGNHGSNLLAEYERLRAAFKPMPGDTVFTFKHPDEIGVRYKPYQNDDFTSRKIEALKIDVRSGDIVNDIGCNEGLVGRWCLDHGAAEVRGYETSWRYLEKAAQAGLTPYLGNVETDPILPADVTLCISVFHYFNNPRGFLAKARKATNRLFVLELPVHRNGGLISEFHPAQGATRHSPELVEHWLKDLFQTVRCVGPSVAPAGAGIFSDRLVYHCFS